MSNAKLYIILKGYRAQLAAAIEKAEAIMPEGVEQRTYKAHITPHGPKPQWYEPVRAVNKMLAEQSCKDESHFEIVPDGYAHLQPLYDLLAELDSDLEMLRSGEEEKEAKRA